MQVFPGYERARANWRRVTAAALSPVSPRRPPLFRLARAQQAINVNLEQPAAASPRRNLVTSLFVTPLLRSAAPRSLQGSMPAHPGTPPVRHRSKSSSSPTSLSNLRDKYTCKVCLATEVEGAIQPCGLCLGMPLLAMLRRPAPPPPGGEARRHLAGWRPAPHPLPHLQGPRQGRPQDLLLSSAPRARWWTIFLDLLFDSSYLNQ